MKEGSKAGVTSQMTIGQWLTPSSEHYRGVVIKMEGELPQVPDSCQKGCNFKKKEGKLQEPAQTNTNSILTV